MVKAALGNGKWVRNERGARTWVSEVDSFKADWAAGMKAAAMGRRYGLTVGGVSGVAKRLGLPGRNVHAEKRVALRGGRWLPFAQIYRWVADPAPTKGQHS